MSLLKKLNKELEKFNNYWNYDLIVRNTEYFHFYEIYDFNNKQVFHYFYNGLLSFKENIKIFHLILRSYYKEIGKLEIKKCYEGKKYLNYKEYEECKKQCYYHNICKIKEIEVKK